MILNIEPYTVCNVGVKLDIQMPEFQLGTTEGYAIAYIFNEQGMVVKSATVKIPADVYTEWGKDDKFIADYVMEQLGVVEQINTEVAEQIIVEATE